MRCFVFKLKTAVGPFAGILLGCTAAQVYALEFGNLELGTEVKVHYRYSEENRFATSFPFPPAALPVGAESAFLETVDAGDHLEVSMIALLGKWTISEAFSAQFRFEGVDRYERNPTSSDHKLGIDTLLFRYGDEFRAMEIPGLVAGYAQIGKFPKFERQRERRTESYGLVSTAFNRFEDSGLEGGFDLPNGLYGKLSITSGNPVFIRDPHALAGDNGTNEFRVPPQQNPDPELKSGIVMLYDAEIEDFDLSDYPEYGLGAGFKWNSVDQQQAFDILAFGYERKMGNDRDLHGTFYGTDLDLFDLGEVPGAGGIRLPAEGNEKTEYGMNIWYQAGNFALFAQYVEQTMAGLGRKGKELELSYVFDLPILVTPVVRYSSLDHDFVGSLNYPAPSVWWDRTKMDYGINMDFSEQLRLTLEYSVDEFTNEAGDKNDNNEAMLTLLWRFR